VPELPEVETTRRGLAPVLVGQRVKAVVVRNRALRQPVPRGLSQSVVGTTVRAVSRRGKYLLVACGAGTLIIHLGMSGRLWVVRDGAAPTTHDHFDLVLENGTVVRLRDPRRFGLVLWQPGEPLAHALLSRIGPEPLAAEFDGSVLHAATRNRSAAIKHVLMDSRVVAGVGNIYASEALFRAGIHPRAAAGRLSLARRHDPRDAGSRHRRRRQQLAGLRPQRRTGRQLSEPVSGLRSRGGAVPALPVADPGDQAGAALDFLLPPMPEKVNGERWTVDGYLRKPQQSDHRPLITDHAFSAISFKYFSCNCSLLSTCRGSLGMQSTGHTFTHCGSA
jgi:formamidopyrimidine-DNA glycosylase